MKRISTVYALCYVKKHQLLQKDILRQWRILNFRSNSTFLDSFSRSGVTDYEKEKLRKVVVPQKFNFASDVLDQWALKEKDGRRTTSIPAFWYVYGNGKEYKLSFQELEWQTKRTASILESSCGIKRGDNVIVMLPKIPEFWLVNIAAVRIGFVLCPATMMLTPKDLAYRFSVFKPSCIIAHETVADVVDSADLLSPTLKEKVIVSSSPCRRKGWIDLNRLQPESDNHKCAETDKDETMMIYFTSGTTGYPKMVEHTHSSYGIGLDVVGKYVLDLTSNNISWGLTDTGWAKTAMCTIFGPWSQGACVFVHQMPRFSPKTTLEVLSKFPIDTFCAAPLIYASLVQENLSAYKFPKLEHCASGGEALNSEVIKKWMAATGKKIYQGYAQTETTGVAVMLKCYEYRIEALGKAMPGVDLIILDDKENELGPGEIGEMALKRKTLPVDIFKGYMNDPETTKKYLTENYFHTGDMGYYDKEGYFYFLGRNDDVINSSGYRIGPYEVESALMSHPAVVECAVVSSPDPQRGEVVKAFIVLKESVEGTEELVKELQEHCKKVTAPYKYPRKIEFVKELPKTITFKIKRSELRKKEWKNAKK